MLFDELSARLPNGLFDFPVAGFANGEITLRLPIPALGLPIQWCEELRTLKALVMRSTAVPLGFATPLAISRADGVVAVDRKAFMSFVGGVIRLNYVASDEQLAWLTQGEAWQKTMFCYAWGGEQTLRDFGAECAALLPQVKLLLAQCRRNARKAKILN